MGNLGGTPARVPPRPGTVRSSMRALDSSHPGESGLMQIHALARACSHTSSGQQDLLLVIAVLVSDLLVKKSPFGIGRQKTFVDDLADIKIFVNGAVFEFHFKGRCGGIVPNGCYIARVNRNSVHFRPRFAEMFVC